MTWRDIHAGALLRGPELSLYSGSLPTPMARGVSENEHSPDIGHSPPARRLCRNSHSECDSCSDLGPSACSERPSCTAVRFEGVTALRLNFLTRDNRDRGFVVRQGGQSEQSLHRSQIMASSSSSSPS